MRSPHSGCGLGRVSCIYTFFRLYRWTGWVKCWTFLVLLVVTVSFWHLTSRPLAWNGGSGSSGICGCHVDDIIDTAAVFSSGVAAVLFSWSSLATIDVMGPQAVTWAWPWQNWGRGWRVLCRVEERGRWLSLGGAAGRPGAPQYGACTGLTVLEFGWSAVRQDRDT